MYRLMAGGGAGEVQPLEGEALQTKVSCQGDIAVQSFYPEDCDGVAWLSLREGPAGEPGRDIRGEVDEGPRLLGEQPGVLIGATDPRSLNVIIAAMMVLRDKLEHKGEPSLEHELCKAISDQVAEDIAVIEDQAIVEDLQRAGAGAPRHEVTKAMDTSMKRPMKRHTTPWGKVTQ